MPKILTEKEGQKLQRLCRFQLENNKDILDKEADEF